MVFSRILELFLMNFPHHLPKADEIPVCSGGTLSGPRQIEHSEGIGLSTNSPTVQSWFCKTHQPTLPTLSARGSKIALRTFLLRHALPGNTSHAASFAPVPVQATPPARPARSTGQAPPTNPASPVILWLIRHLR